MNKIKIMIVLQLFVLLGLPECGYTQSHGSTQSQRAPRPGSTVLTSETGLPKAPLAKPLDNGVIFDNNFSVAVALVQRYPTKTIISLAFRKISEDWRPVRKKLRLRIIDDRQNKYETSFEINGRIFSLKGEPPDLGNIPSGFTWISSAEIRKIPEIAPISKIEIEDSKTCFDLDFRNPKLPELGFEIKPEQLLSPDDEIQIDKHLSFRVGNLSVNDEFSTTFGRERGFDITLPLVVRNIDYNPRSMVKLFAGVLMEDGRVLMPHRIGGGGPDIEALSTGNYNIRIFIGFEKELGGAISVPRMLLLYKYPSSIRGYQFYRFVPISSELKHCCSEMLATYVILESAKTKLKEWARENLKVVIKHGLGYRSERVIAFDDFSIVGNHVWAAGHLSGYGGRGHLVHSPDGGDTWEILWKSDKTGLQKVHFLNEKEGFIATKTTILETSDGGRIWNSILTVRHAPIWGITQIEDIVVEDDRSMSVRLKAGPEVIKTADGGSTWILFDGNTPKVRTHDGGETWQKIGTPESSPVAVPSPAPRRSEKEEKSEEARPQSPSKQELVDALEELRHAMMRKIQTETDVTAQCFTSVKEYRRARLLADVLRPVLRVLQGTLSVLSKISDTTTLSGQVKTSLDNAQYVSEATSLFFMVNGLRQSGEKLYYAIDDTAGYVQTIEDMVKAADRTTVVRMNSRSYKMVIKQYLDSVEGTPLVIARTSKLAPGRKPAKGALMLYKTIREEFRMLIDQIQRSELPQDFPLQDAVTEITQLKNQIIESGTHNIDVSYSIYRQGRKVHQSRKLGAIAEHNKAFAQVARSLAKRLDIEIHAECAQLTATGADAAYIVTYKIPGAGEAVKITQQISLVPQVVIEGEKMFTVDPEDEFYQMPQEMVFGLAIEFSNLWRIADDTVLSIAELLQKEPKPIPAKSKKIEVEKAKEVIDSVLDLLKKRKR